MNKKISLFISVLILISITACSPVEITPAQPVPTMIESMSTPFPTTTATLTATPTITFTPTPTYTSTSTDIPTPTHTPTLSIADRLWLDETTREEYMDWFKSLIDNPSFIEVNTISSGVFDAMELTLPDGTTYKADILWLYAPNNDETDLYYFPTLLGVQRLDSTYITYNQHNGNFIDYFGYEKWESLYDTSSMYLIFDRETFLDYAHKYYPKGQFAIIGSVSLENINGDYWVECEQKLNEIARYNKFPAPPDMCRIGRYFSEKDNYQTYNEVIFRQRNNNVPIEQLIAGFFFN